MYKYYIKPIIDFGIAVTIFILLFPIFFIIMLILFFTNHGSVFFTQKRPGKNSKIFKIVKFKTMSDEKDASGNYLSDEKRLTWLGKILRKTSLDELPQLFNVMKGDMSLIGPRPLLPEYLPFYNEYHKQRHNVKPGITGLSQVEGRDKAKFSERFDMDVEYVQNISFILDVKILFLTFIGIFNTSNVLNGQTVEEVDDLGITKNLSPNYFKNKL